MQEIDVLIDDQTELALEMVQLDIRNQQAHKELQAYNDTGAFIFIHKLTANAKYKRTQRDELRKLKEENPEAFLNEITNLNQNIRRIESNIRKRKYKDEAEHQSWCENLENAKIKKQIIVELM